MIHDRSCHRCGVDRVLAVLSVPGTWTNASGNRFPVIREVHLCARCDANDPVAGPVVGYLTAHGPGAPGDMTQLARDLLRWIDQARPAEPDKNTASADVEAALSAEADAWRRGEW